MRPRRSGLGLRRVGFRRPCERLLQGRPLVAPQSGAECDLRAGEAGRLERQGAAERPDFCSDWVWLALSAH